MSATFFTECGIRIALSFVAGFVLGLERKFRQQVVGMRTLILISESSTLLSILSIYMAHIAGVPDGDPTRITAGVISGIGFLGGGAILRQGLNIKGLTSAAIIWTASAIGLAIGAGLYLPAGITLAVCICSLVFLERIEEKYFPAGRMKSLQLTFDGADVDFSKVRRMIAESGLILHDMNMTQIIDHDRIILQCTVKTPPEVDLPVLRDKLKTTGKLSEFAFVD
jgi:putative Mg2+ transporter-C (MgtC) family protein